MTPSPDALEFLSEVDLKNTQALDDLRKAWLPLVVQ